MLVVAALVGGFFLGKPVWTPKVDPQLHPTVTYGPDGFLKTQIGLSYRCFNAAVQQGVVIGDDNSATCEKSHTLEVYDVGDILPTENYSSDGAQVAAYPGLESVTRLAEARCAAAFHSSVVPENQRAGLTYQAIVPTQRQWELARPTTTASPAESSMRAREARQRPDPGGDHH